MMKAVRYKDIDDLLEQLILAHTHTNTHTQGETHRHTQE